MEGGAWRAIVHGVARVGCELAAKLPPPPPPSRSEIWQQFLSYFIKCIYSLMCWKNFAIEKQRFFVASSVQSLNRIWLLQPDEPQHTKPPCLSPTPEVYSNPRPLSHPLSHGDAIQPCHPLSSPSPPALNLSQHQGLFQWVLFESGGQSIGASASTSVLPVNTQDWSPLGWTGWISLLSKGLSRVFSNTTVQKHQFFCAQLSL